jgi:hypothetical protein
VKDTIGLAQQYIKENQALQSLDGSAAGSRINLVFKAQWGLKSISMEIVHMIQSNHFSKEEYRYRYK